MNLQVTSSPHIRGPFTTRGIMTDVVIALLPALLAGAWFFGVRVLLVALISVAAALAAEVIVSLLLRRGLTVTDGSASVTGLLLALTLPPAVPYWVAALGSAFAIIVVKGLCGGLGQNIFNPALAGRAFLMLVVPVHITRFTAPGAALSLFGSNVDAVTAATPLHHMVMPTLPEESLWDMFLGNIGGCAGEVSALALLLGGAYLLVRKVISIRIPGAYLGTVAVLSLVFFRAGDPLSWMLYSVLGGGVLLGALFMASDYATSPVTPKGQILYGIGCGVLTVVFRSFGLYPEGVTYAILLMNACVWAADRLTPPKRFGAAKGGAAR